MWSHDTGSAVPSRVSLVIFHTQAESGADLRDSSRVPWRRPYIHLKTAIRHRVSPELIGARNCVPMAFTAESIPAHSQTGAALAGHHGPITTYPLLVRSGHIQSTGLYMVVINCVVFVWLMNTVSIGINSLGTPPRLTFQARLLHNQEGANAKRAVFERSRRELSSDVSFGVHILLGCGAIEPGKSVLGVSQDSDTYGIICD